MTEVLVFLAIAAATSVAVVVAAVQLLLRRLDRANRVVPCRSSHAPIGWLWSWRQPARLHRRLRRAAQVAELAVTPLRRGDAPPSTLHDVAGELVARAGTVDDWLVAASRLDRYWGQGRLAELSVEVRDLERSAYRLQLVSAEWRARFDRAAQGAVPPPNLHERLDAVEAALQELPAGA